MADNDDTDELEQLKRDLAEACEIATRWISECHAVSDQTWAGLYEYRCCGHDHLRIAELRAKTTKPDEVLFPKLAKLTALFEEFFGTLTEYQRDKLRAALTDDQLRILTAMLGLRRGGN